MSLTTSEMTPADIGAICGNNNDGGFGGNGAWWIIILFLFAFCGWGGNWGGYGGSGGGSSVKDQYVLSSDFATIQRMIGDGNNMIERKLDNQNAGICDLGYTQAQLINNASMSQMQSANAIQSQLAQCCCDVRDAISGVNYNMAMNTNALQSAVQTGFCQTNFNGQSNTRDIIDSQNANTRAILDAIQANKVEALKDRIAEQNQQINALNLAASQTAQNAYLIDKLNPNKCPQPAYVVQPPQQVTFPNYSNGCGCGC